MLFHAQPTYNTDLLQYTHAYTHNADMFGWLSGLAILTVFWATTVFRGLRMLLGEKLSQGCGRIPTDDVLAWYRGKGRPGESIRVGLSIALLHDRTTLGQYIG